MIKTTRPRRINKRLRPLYWGIFFQSMMFWYAIEKLFMQHLGFNDAQIALAGILISGTMVVTQVPTGILADRWSRKGTLVLASIALGFDALGGILSHSVFVYLVYAAILWAIYASVRIGTSDAIIYDLLTEETGSAEGFEFYYGRLSLYSATGFMVSALLSSLIGRLYGLRATFLLSLPLVAISIICFLRFREPTIHKHIAKAPYSATPHKH